MIETNSNVKEGSQDSLTQKNIVRTCLQVHIHGEWMLPSLMRSFVRQSSIRELCTLAFHELTVDLLLPVCYNRIHTHTHCASLRCDWPRCRLLLFKKTSQMQISCGSKRRPNRGPNDARNSVSIPRSFQPIDANRCPKVHSVETLRRLLRRPFAKAANF